MRHGHSLTNALNAALPAVPLKDQAFVQAVCYGVCRNYQRLDFILNQLLDKPLKDADVKALALVGLYQLSDMRVKPHAAVHETVSAARKKPWAKLLINAVLRNYLRQRDDLEHRANQQPSAVVNHPDWLIALFERDWTVEQAQALLHAGNQAPPMVLRVNVQKTTRADYLQQLATADIAATASLHCPTAIVLEKPVAISALPNFADGAVSVQDSAAQLASVLLDAQAGQRVLDLCAAPGGKTAHILEMQPQLKELIAVDNDAARMQRVAENLQRLNLTAHLIVGDATTPADWFQGELFERILVDAPCSALGVIRRHPDIKLLRRPDDLAALQHLQAQILNAAWQLLSPNGVLLYATCSVNKQENVAQIAQFLASHSDARELPIVADWGIEQAHGRQILTGMDGMDGFYYARLIKH
jgi:16S rRNA (cytosine967-C5)-methyltransferase